MLLREQILQSSVNCDVILDLQGIKFLQIGKLGLAFV